MSETAAQGGQWLAEAEIVRILRRNIIARWMGPDSFVEGFEEAAAEIAALRAAETGTGGTGGAEDLDARLKAASMYTVPEMMGVTPLTRWVVHAGMTNLDFFGAWLERRTAEYLRMKAPYELREKDKADELYEWVCAHSAAFSEIWANFCAARADARDPAPSDPQDLSPPDRRGHEGDGR